MTSLRARIVSGSGRYQDPWHPFARTSRLLAELLEEEGFAAEVEEDVDRGLRDLGGVDLLVGNFAMPKEPDPADAATREGVLAYLQRGGPLLGLHVVAGQMLAVPEWESIVGGCWVAGVTMHPRLGPSQIHVHPERHPIAAPLHDFELIDERYTHLRLAPDVNGMATHELEGAEHPLVWARGYGGSRVVFDALGHDERSYASPEHRELIRRSARWLVARLD